MKINAVIDNTVLVNLFEIQSIKLINLLQNVFQRVYIPIEVKKEFAAQSHRFSERQIFIDKLRINYGFFRLCNNYDSLQLALLKTYKGINHGEAEATSQYMKINANLLLTDDKRFVKAIEEKNFPIRVGDTLFLLAILDIHQLLKLNRSNCFTELYNHHKFKSSTLREAYKKVNQYYEMGLSKKVINQKSSFKLLGLK